MRDDAETMQQSRGGPTCVLCVHIVGVCGLSFRRLCHLSPQVRPDCLRGLQKGSRLCYVSPSVARQGLAGKHGASAALQ